MDESLLREGDAVRMLMIALVMTSLFAAGCEKSHETRETQHIVRLALNWVPEPEFGGFYEADRSGAFKKHELMVEIQPGGAGAPIVQRVEAGEVEFGIASADEVIIARSRGADVVAIFTVYQTCPQGIMSHASRGFKTINDVFANPGTLAMEPGLPYAKYLKEKFGFEKVKVVPYSGGAAQFLADKDFSQQCFIFAEPLSAKKQGGDPQTFLVADAGYNPYTGVVITRGDYIKSDSKNVHAMIESCREGWQEYLKDPKPANAVMGQLNKTMDAETFAAAAESQKPLVEAKDVKLGSMTVDRWDTLAKQLVDLKVIEQLPAGKDCMLSQ